MSSSRIPVESQETELVASELKPVWRAQFMLAVLVGLIVVLEGMLQSWSVRHWIGLAAFVGGLASLFSIGLARVVITPTSIQEWKMFKIGGNILYSRLTSSIRWTSISEVSDEETEMGRGMGSGNLVLRGAENSRSVTIRLSPTFTNYQRCVELVRELSPAHPSSARAREIIGEATGRGGA
jgi:hypothetical protein